MKNVMSRMINKERKGFSLVELVVVILIIAILAAAIFLGGATVIRQSRESAVRNDLRNLGTYVQDAMYATPKLQYDTLYSKGEYFTYDSTDSKVIAKLTANDDKEAKADTIAAGMEVLELLNENYLTADFQIGIGNKDPWNNPYCFSYEQIPSSATGKSSSCIIVVNSLGTNSLDETSDGATKADGKKTENMALKFKGDMAADAKQKAYTSAQAFVAAQHLEDSDDYGVVICMIDGQVSTAYYGF